VRPLQIGEVLRDRLLRDTKRRGDFVHRGRPDRLAIQDGPAGGVRQGDEGSTQLIHNSMVVYFVDKVKG
jgi:hypothetical protein